MSQLRYKPVSIMMDDYKDFEVIREAWVKEHKARISMPQMLKIAMDAYKEANNL